MSATIQIRNVPDTLHHRMKARAILARMSLSDYLLDHLRALADQPTMKELQARLQQLPPFMPSASPTQAIRAARNRR
ncbi:antitoxin [soil metagenome]